MRILVTFPTRLEATEFLKSALPDVDVSITGVGVPSTIFQLQNLIAESSYDLIIQAGICGSFNIDKFQIGSSYLVEKDVFADIGIIENNELISMNELGFFHPDEAKFKDGWLINNGNIFTKLDLQKCTSITINTLVENINNSALFIKKYQPQIESMEGAALHYVCLMKNIEFLQMRTVSNLVGERDKDKWHFNLAIYNMTEKLQKIIKTVQNENAVL